MRRKLFFYVLLLTIGCFVFLGLIQNLNNEVQKETNEEKYYTGKTVSIETYEDGQTELVVKLENKDKILLKYHGNALLSEKYYGQKITFKTRLEKPQQSRNPKCFDYRRHLKSRGINYIASTKDIEFHKTNLTIYEKYCRYLLIKKEAFLFSIENEETRNFIDGILFGSTSNLDDNIYDEFKKNGTAHVLAVSGLHINIIYMLIQRFLGKKQTIINLILTLFIIWSMGILAGFTPSVIRAAGMISMKVIALYKDLRYDSLTAMSVVAFLLILHNPYVVYNVAFQMTFLAVLSIKFIMPHIPRKVPYSLAIVIAVNMGLAPYQIFQFNTFSFTSFVANIPVVYMVGILVPIAFIQFVLHMFFDIDVYLIMQALSNMLIFINSFLGFKMDKINIVSPALWMIVLFYLIVGFVISESFYILFARKKYLKIFIIFLIIVIFSAFSIVGSKSAFDECELVFVDVGQGDCMHVKANEKNIMIDGGGSVAYEVGKNIVLPYLLKNNVNRIDLAIATHKHTDHYKGLEELKGEGMIDKIDVGITAGKIYKISEDIYIEALWPVKRGELEIDQDENKNCSVFMVNYKGKKILITGDLDEEGEKKLLQKYSGTNVLKADILKLGHHGSRYSTSDEFLNEVNPKYCVIQVGKNNYGHPHTKTIEKCDKKCIILLRNDIHGAIGFSLDEEKIKYCSMY